MEPETTSTDKPPGWSENRRQATPKARFFFGSAMILTAIVSAFIAVYRPLDVWQILYWVAEVALFDVTAVAFVLKKEKLRLALFLSFWLLFAASGVVQIITSKPPTVLPLGGWLQAFMGSLQAVAQVVQWPIKRRQQASRIKPDKQTFSMGFCACSATIALIGTNLAEVLCRAWDLYAI